MVHFTKPSAMIALLIKVSAIASYVAATLLPCSVVAANQEPPSLRCVVIEVYAARANPKSDVAVQAVQKLAESREGVRLAVRWVDESEDAKRRLSRIAKHFRFDGNSVPVIYTCNRVIRNGHDVHDYYRQLSGALTMEVFTRHGCRRCETVKSHMPAMMQRYPGIQVVYHEITSSRYNQQQLNDLVRRHHKAASSTPVFHFCNDLLIGFDRPETTGVRIQQTLDRWMTKCPQPSPKPSVQRSQSSAREVAAHDPF